METQISPAKVAFDPMSPDVWESPYPFYAKLRKKSPVAWVEPTSGWHLLLAGGMTTTRGFWLLTRYSDINKALVNPALGHCPPQEETPLTAHAPSCGDSALKRTIENWPLFLDPPKHTRIKKALSRILVSLPLGEIADRSKTVAIRKLKELSQKDSFDLIGDFAYEIPMRVISALIGVPESDHAMLTEWSYALYAALEFGPDDQDLEDASHQVEVATDYFRDLIAKRLMQPKTDIVSGLVFADDQESTLSEEEILSNCILMLFAGHDTTLNVIGNAAQSLLRDPNLLNHFQMAGVVDSDSLREFLRHESPQQLAIRYAVSDFKIYGQTIRSGDLVCLALGSANRDPDIFENPDQLNFNRKKQKHMAFGKGIHTCPGSGLGIAMSSAALSALLPVLPKLDLISWSWASNSIMRGLNSLRVEYR